MRKKPSVFIGSSSESEAISLAFHEHFELQFEPVYWKHDVFRPSQATMSELIEATNEFDFAVLIWSSDDEVTSRGVEYSSPRDNVIFEAGLFVGAIGVDRVFIVKPKNNSIKMPSDLLGVTIATYQDDRSDKRWTSATASAASKISQQMADLGPRELAERDADFACAVCYTEIDGEICYRLVRTTKKRYILPKGLILPRENPQIAAQRYAEDEAGIRGRVEHRSNYLFNYYKEDRDEYHSITVYLLKSISEAKPRELFRDPVWLNYDDAIEALSHERAFRHAEPIRNVLDWARTEIENTKSDEILLSGALPYRVHDSGQIEFLLITSKRSGNWLIPKGHVGVSEDKISAAAREAFEEAGVRGTISANPAGSYMYRRLSTNYQVDVYPLSVSEEEVDWPESFSRQRKWYHRDAAAEIVNETGLAEVIRQFTP